MGAVGWWPRKICRHPEIIVLYDLPSTLEPYPSRPRKRTLLSNLCVPDANHFELNPA
jgi:hypothetical protein